MKVSLHRIANETRKTLVSSGPDDRRALGWHVLESRPAGMAAPAVSKREVVAKHVKPYIKLLCWQDIHFFLMLENMNRSRFQVSKVIAT